MPLQGAQQHQAVVLTCVHNIRAVAGIMFTTFTVLNLLHSTGSLLAVPFEHRMRLVALWFVISVPMTCIGGLLALRAPLITWPTHTSKMPRHIPPPPAAADPYVLYAAAGILPFCTVFIELYFAMSSMWQGYFYYLFGFLFIVAFLMILITAEVAILCTCAPLPALTHACGLSYLFTLPFPAEMLAKPSSLCNTFARGQHEQCRHITLGASHVCSLACFGLSSDTFTC